jgi:signal transduction histidine kinase
VVRDFTAQRATETRAREAIAAAVEAQRRAEDASKARGLFMASVNHEIRGAVNALLGYIHLLEHETSGPLPTAYRAQLVRMQHISKHLLGIIDDMLDHSRLESGRFQVRHSRSRIGNAIEAALAIVEPQARAKGVKLDNAVAGYGSDITYFGDEHRVRQILVNLLTNAIKFTPAGGTVKASAGSAEKPSPDAELAGKGPWVYVRIEDNGQGIPPNRLAAIFEPFEQVHFDSPDVQAGSGLGLSISRRLARLMGGDLTAQSDVNQGSKFFLWLQVAETDPGTEP